MKKVCTIALVLVLIALVFVMCGCDNKDLITGDKDDIAKIQASYRNNIGVEEDISSQSIYPEINLNDVPSYFTEFNILCSSGVEVNSLSFELIVEKGDASKLECAVSTSVEGQKIAIVTTSTKSSDFVTFNCTFTPAFKVEYDEKLTDTEKMEYAINIVIPQNEKENNIQLSIRNIKIN